MDSSGEVLFRHDLGDQLLALTVSPDGSRLTAVGMSRRRLWSVGDGRLLTDTGTAWSVPQPVQQHPPGAAEVSTGTYRGSDLTVLEAVHKPAMVTVAVSKAVPPCA
ncbi:hypothetical protein ACFU44_33835 [Nocardia rhizosphaerihabitans]|uniref:hypothetical protein n=1 Tax=Nocardia rhizosphaerihabitans TaxID=1691570 RepID=UPI00366D7039